MKRMGVFILRFICFKCRVTERGRNTDTERELPFASLFPRCQNQPGLGQFEARIKELSNVHGRNPST